MDQLLRISLIFIASFWMALLAPHDICGQEALPDGRFLELSTKVGAQVHYILKYKHRPEQEVLFPDSTYDFAPFELLEKTFFPTKTLGQYSVDSVVYTLATYDTDLRQGLALPVYIASEESLDGKRAVFPRPDSIELEPLITALPDTLTLFEDTQMAYVSSEFNYPYLVMGVSAILILLLLAYILFGNKIKKTWQLRRLKKQFAQFSTKYDTYISKPSGKEVAEAMSLWRIYTGKLIDLPLASYTTKEISRTIEDSKVQEALQVADRAVYAGIITENISEHLKSLKTFAHEAYQRKIQAIHQS